MGGLRIQRLRYVQGLYLRIGTPPSDTASTCLHPHRLRREELLA